MQKPTPLISQPGVQYTTEFVEGLMQDYLSTCIELASLRRRHVDLLHSQRLDPVSCRRRPTSGPRDAPPTHSHGSPTPPRAP